MGVHRVRNAVPGWDLSIYSITTDMQLGASEPPSGLGQALELDYLRAAQAAGLAYIRHQATPGAVPNTERFA